MTAGRTLPSRHIATPKNTGERLVPDLLHKHDGLAQKLFQQHLVRYGAVADWVRGASVLDIACGSGFGARMLADAGAKHVTAVDSDAAIITYARERYGTSGITFQQGTHECLADESFDIIACLETLEHVSNPDDFLDALVHRLKPDGRLFISATIIPTTLLYKYHIHDFDKDAFLGLLQSRLLRIDTLVSQDFHVSPKMVRQSMALHRQSPDLGRAFKNPVAFISALVSSCFVRGLEYKNLMAVCSK